MAIEKLKCLLKKHKRSCIGGATLLDPEFSKEYLQQVGIKQKKKYNYVILLNVLTNSNRRYLGIRAKLTRILGGTKCKALPTGKYNEQLKAFWAIRV